MVLLAQTGLQDAWGSVLAPESQLTAFLTHVSGSEDWFLVFINKFRWKIKPSFSFHVFDFVRVCIPLKSLCCTSVSITAVTSLSLNVLFVEPVPEVHIFCVLTVVSALPRTSSICPGAWQSYVCLVQWYGHCPHFSLFVHLRLAVALSGTVVFWGFKLGAVKVFFTHAASQGRSVTVTGSVPVCSLAKVNSQASLHVLSHLHF